MPVLLYLYQYMYMKVFIDVSIHISVNICIYISLSISLVLKIPKYLLQEIYFDKDINMDIFLEYLKNSRESPVRNL